MKIFIENIQFQARHGVIPQENVVGATFYVSVTAETEYEQASITDKLSDTVSYAEIIQTVREEMEVPSQLVEHVAGRIGRRLLSDFPTLSQVHIKISKCNPPIVGLQCSGAGVEITLQRS